MSLDIYIPSLQLAIEYDGVFYHVEKAVNDSGKTRWCRNHGIYLVHIQEKKSTQEKSRKRNEIAYYYSKNYKNIGVAVHDLFTLINKKFGLSIEADVDLARDKDEFVSYVQYKFHKLKE
jgi:hypothetical protein